MKRIEKLFSGKKCRILSVYCTAGFPGLNDTMKVISALVAAGADMVEVGMPYSDPLADGPVIQASSARALRNGMNMEVLFRQLQHLRPFIEIPVILMGYLNPVMQYGFERFCEDARRCGVDGIIIPDIPPGVYEREYRKTVEDQGLDFIFLITPETSEERIRMIDGLSSGFIYAVSSSSVTGSGRDFAEVEAYLKRLAGMKLRNPLMAGFGISKSEDFESVTRHVPGAIIGSAFIKALEEGKEIEEVAQSFVKNFEPLSHGDKKDRFKV